jgi:outer membrane protein, heavy metal efflux system
MKPKLHDAPPLLLAALVLSGCAALPSHRAIVDQHADLAQARVAIPLAFDAPMRTAPSGEIDLKQALRHALNHSPRVRQLAAELDQAYAAHDSARRLPNPRLHLERLRGLDGAATEIARELAVQLDGVLTLPARGAIARATLEATVLDAADALASLARETEAAWFAAIGAGLRAELAALDAATATLGAKLAQRYAQAGNLSARELAEAQREKVSAELKRVRAEVKALRARHALAALMGAEASADWRVPSALPAPVDGAWDFGELLALARDQRLDLRATQATLSASRTQRRATTAFGWLGELELGAADSREGDERRQGATLGFALPLFDQGQPARREARAAEAQAEAHRERIALKVSNQVDEASRALKLHFAAATTFAGALPAQAARVDQETNAELNFMLTDVFARVGSRRVLIAAHADYVSEVQAYWLAYIALKRAVGGALPNEPALPPLSIDLHELRVPSDPHEAHQHHGHDHHQHDAGDTP